MPNRLLREGICTSDPINELSPEEEVLFYRLLVVADDFGHMDGRVPIIKAQCFPLKETATVARIGTWVDGLVAKSMLARYESGGRQFLAIMRWECRVRTNPKYPLPSDDDCQRFAAVCAQPAVKVPPGLGLGLGKGASSNVVAFDAAEGRFAVPDLMAEQWGKAYPAVDIPLEVAKAAAWLVANPKNAKSNYARFLTNWLTKAQDKAPRLGGGRPAQSEFAGAI